MTSTKPCAVRWEWDVRGDFAHYRVYGVGPLAGARIAVCSAHILRAEGETAISRAAGAGVLEPGPLERMARLWGEIERGAVIRPGIGTSDRLGVDGPSRAGNRIDGVPPGSER